MDLRPAATVPMAAAPEAADTPAQPGHDHHPADAPQEDDAGCDCNPSHCRPPVGLVQGKHAP